MYRVSGALSTLSLFVLLAICTGGCASQIPPSPTELVAAADVMNSVFCGIALASEKAKPARLPKWAIVTLQLKVVNSDSIGIGIGSSKPPTASGGSAAGSSGGSGGSSGGGSHSGSTAKTSVVASQSTALAPGLGLGYSEGWTVDTQTDLTIEMTNVTNSDVCKQVNVTDASAPTDFGLATYLDSTIRVAAAAQGLAGGNDKYKKLNFTYDANFAVIVQASATTGPVVAIVPLSATADASRNDLQHLKLVMSDELPREQQKFDLPREQQKSGQYRRLQTPSGPIRLRDIRPVPYF